MSADCTTSIPVVLVVEDGGLVRMMAVDMLEDAGFEVVEAATADAALTILETDPAIAVLFTDIDMPGSMFGLDLADRVAERWPHIRLVVTSGRFRLTNQEVPDSGWFVPKRYHADQVLHAVEKAGRA
jgi:two-component system, response regulator PdtaR